MPLHYARPRALQRRSREGDSGLAPEARGGPHLSSRPHPAAWIAVLAGLAWLFGSGALGPGAALLGILPGSLLLAGGVASRLLPGDLRTPQLAAAGGLAGTLLALPMLLLVDVGFGLVALGLSLAAFTAAGWVALESEPVCEDVPAPPTGVRYAAKAALDEAMLGTVSWLQPRPDPEDLRQMAAEISRAEELFHALGWDDQPADFHATPPPLEAPELSPARTGGTDYEHLRFESGYDPKGEIPGRERWLGYAENRTAHAWVRRHPGGPRPWLVCLHGFGMGSPLVDLRAFRSDWLHRELGLDIAHFVLPVHGPRAPDRLSGARFMSPSFLNVVHAEAQAMWDLRRLLGWIRAQGAPAVGVCGLSLGGYTAALLAGLDPELRCAIAGIPPTDLTRAFRRYAPPRDALVHERLGLDWDAVARVLRVVSPLALEPRVAAEGRFLFAATGDRFVPPGEVRELWLHWGRPRIAWSPGSHVTALYEAETRALLRDAIETRLLVS